MWPDSTSSRSRAWSVLRTAICQMTWCVHINKYIYNHQSATSSAERSSLLSDAVLWLFDDRFGVKRTLRTRWRLNKESWSCIVHKNPCMLCKTCKQCMQFKCCEHSNMRTGLLSSSCVWICTQTWEVWCFCPIDLVTLVMAHSLL